MISLSRYAFAPLRKEEGFILYRGRSNVDGSQILVRSPASEHPAPESLQRLESEYSLRAQLEPAWAVRPIAIARHWDRTVLVLEDPGGVPLDQLLSRPLDRFPGLAPHGDLTFSLGVAVGLSRAIDPLHQRGILHKDIKPANVLVNSVTGQCWLTGFGIASRLPRQRQYPEAPELIAGTLPYMAPEQTGRMNRSIDSRSDLYSLGITLYEMFTGVLPFEATDPMEWVHCHIARQPVSPGERRRDVPAPVAAIIMKLLAKTAEERYQTAAGVESDLRHCLAGWQTQRRIAEFALGDHDAPDRLLIPEKLYGRAREVETLLASFDRVVETGRPELVLVSGYSGIGKSSAVNELHKVLVPPRGLFASGKFDQYTRDIPYSTLVQAFQSLVRPLLGKGEAELATWRRAFLDALNPNARLMADLIPELKLIIGEQPPLPELEPQQAQSRFQLVFRRFIDVFARPEHPLVLFLDDLQWLDAATLDLMEDLFSWSDLHHLMLVGAYRDNEVDAAHPLTRKLDAIRKAGAKVQEIRLAPLPSDDLGQLIADALRCEPSSARRLAQLVHEKTAGNPFFVIQFLYALSDEGLLRFDHETACWSWDLDRIRNKGYTDNVVDLMVGKLTRLPAETQQALEQLACLGNVAAVGMLSMVLETSEAQVHGALWEAVRQELVERKEGAYKFVDDRVQEAAYSLIPESSRAEVNLRIGRLLVTQTPAERREEAIFEIVTHLNRGAMLITSAEEQQRVGELNLIAGQRAKQSTAYNSALTYVAAGRAQLPEDCWERCPTLTFALEFHRAQCEFLTGALSAADERLSMLSSRAGRIVDFAAVTHLREELFTTLGQSDRAIEICLDYLRHIGVEWSAHPMKEEVRQEYERLWRQIGRRSIEELVDLPPITDPEWRATMDVLTAVVSPALFTDQNLLCLVICRMANLSLEYGNSDGSCFAYVWLGMILGPHFGDYRAGFRFGKLGLDLVEKRGLRRFEARVYLIFGHRVIPWTQAIRNGRSLVRRAFDAANEIGDLTFAAYSCDNWITNLLACGDPLGDVEREAEAGLGFARRARFGLVIDRITTQLRLVRTLRGLTPEFASFNDTEFDEGRFERHLEEEPHLAIAACWYWIRKLQARFFAGTYAPAIAAAAKAERLLWTSPSFFELAEYHLYAALTRAALCDAASVPERTKHLAALAAHHHQLQVWAQNCPENFENRDALVGAEIARIEGRDGDAMRLYEQAIRSARANGFIHNEALANELAARFYAARGFEKIVRVYLQDARYCYLRWGADGKVRQLEKMYPHLRTEEAAPGSTSSIGTPVERLDLATIIKVSQAVSGETVLEKLIDTLMRRAVEHAGAERGLLILLRGVEQWIESEATTDGDSILVRLQEASVANAVLPESIIRYVVRTQESVILDDASAQNPFSEDTYIRQHRARSILCLPLVNQGKLIGVLYLENNLTPYVFTPNRIAVLKLLASQAAISLENTRLYRDLRASEERWSKLAENSSAGIALLAQDGRFIAANLALQKMLGYTEDELQRRTAMDITHEEDRAATRARIAEFDQGVRRVHRVEKRYLRKDGGVVWADISTVFVPASGSTSAFSTVVIVDITERKRAEEELRRREVELAHVGRVATMGELAASIAHEVNQPLAGITTNANAGLRWLTGESPNLNEGREAIRRIIRDGRRASDVISRMRALFKKDYTAKERLDLNEVIEEVVILIQSEVRRNKVALRTELAANLPSVMGDRVQLQQVLMNLVLNSIEAMNTVEGRERDLLIRTQRGEADEVRVAVRDSGIGFDLKNAEQLFAAFHTTKPGGMGMGLSISRSIVQYHGGRLWAVLNDGPGATFQFTLFTPQ